MSNLTNRNCPFCQPRIAQSTWLETPHHRVIYNIAPIVPGHSLVVPKQHVSSLLHLSPDEVGQLFQTAQEAVLILLEVFDGQGFDLSLQNGEVAGQTVAHLHVHLVPRRPGDLLDQDWHQQVLDSRSRPRLTAQAIQAAVQRLRETAQKLGVGEIA
jgi:bis(5'-adenosyl)-triphosphatase